MSPVASPRAAKHAWPPNALPIAVECLGRGLALFAVPVAKLGLLPEA
jgi:hypothetical protein